MASRHSDLPDKRLIESCRRIEEILDQCESSKGLADELASLSKCIGIGAGYLEQFCSDTNARMIDSRSCENTTKIVRNLISDIRDFWEKRTSEEGLSESDDLTLCVLRDRLEIARSELKTLESYEYSASDTSEVVAIRVRLWGGVGYRYDCLVAPDKVNRTPYIGRAMSEGHFVTTVCFYGKCLRMRAIGDAKPLARHVLPNRMYDELAEFAKAADNAGGDVLALCGFEPNDVNMKVARELLMDTDLKLSAQDSDPFGFGAHFEAKGYATAFYFVDRKDHASTMNINTIIRESPGAVIAGRVDGSISTSVNGEELNKILDSIGEYISATRPQYAPEALALVAGIKTMDTSDSESARKTWLKNLGNILQSCADVATLTAVFGPSVLGLLGIA